MEWFRVEEKARKKKEKLWNPAGGTVMFKEGGEELLYSR
jgi:hypothetical protein